MTRFYGLALAGAAAGIVAGQLPGGLPGYTALGLVGLSLAGLTTRLSSYRRRAAVPLALTGAALVASAGLGPWGLAGVLAAMSGLLLGLGAARLWRHPAPDRTQAETEPARNPQLWAVFSAGQDPTDDSEAVT
ncbi:MAG: hypothetical protein Q4B08_00845 [Propionibacteriaceae bacterium]|nr:hypothetical protein [Propionibacteriaceae bacterium]